MLYLASILSLKRKKIFKSLNLRVNLSLTRSESAALLMLIKTGCDFSSQN